MKKVDIYVRFERVYKIFSMVGKQKEIFVKNTTHLILINDPYFLNVL